MPVGCEMNELQACELEILKQVIQVFDKLNIQYFMIGGSALGAVKYQGFIPWDDDIDIGLYREDYNKFLGEAHSYLPSHLFLQNHHTDRKYAQVYSKVRNCNTTYIEKSVAHLDINHGVYIDVFPLDGYPRNVEEQAKLENKKRLYKFVCESNYRYKRSAKEKLVVRALRLLAVSKWTGSVLKKYERLIASYDVQDSDTICNHGNWKGKLEYVPKEYYGEGTWTTFEDIQVRVPEKYDAYLTQKYGNWRVELPEEEQRGHHYHEVCDVNQPYSNYTK